MLSSAWPSYVAPRNRVAGFVSFGMTAALAHNWVTRPRKSNAAWLTNHGHSARGGFRWVETPAIESRFLRQCPALVLLRSGSSAAFAMMDEPRGPERRSTGKTGTPVVGRELPGGDSIQAITDSANGLQVSRSGPVRLDLLPDSANAGIHAPWRHELHVPPHRIEKQIAGEHLTPVTCKVFDQARLQTCGWHFTSSDRKFPG